MFRKHTSVKGKVFMSDILYISIVNGHGVSSHSVVPFKANLKKFMEYIQQRSVEKVCRFLEKGLDPNFHDVETGGEDEIFFLKFIFVTSLSKK